MPCRFYQDSSHGLGRSRKEMAATVPGRFILTLHESEICLVHQRGRLECLSRLLTRQFCRCQLTQFVVNQRQQLFRGLWIAVLDLRQDTRDIGHGYEDSQPSAEMPEKHLSLDCANCTGPF